MAEESHINQISKVDQREPWEKNPKFNLKLVILISFGFFSTSVWSFYDSQVSLALKGLFSNLFLVGFIMTVDNIIGVFVQPWTGSLSDRTRSRFGRRMPFVLIGLPISAFFFLCLGLTKDNPVLYILVVLGFITSMAFWRAPIVALMPDFVHPQDRSKGNAIVNALAGVGTAALSLVGGIILDINYALAFALLAGVMIVALIILFVGVKEPDTRNWDFSPKEGSKKEKKPSFTDNLRFIMQEEDKSMIWMMLAIFSWFIAYNTGSTFISIYATEFFAFSAGQAAFLVTATAVSFLLFAAVSVWFAKKISRRKTIMLGLTVWFVGYLIGSIAVGPSNSFILYITTILMGFGWACININSIVMVWQMAPDEKSTGVSTGLYYAASFTSQIVGPLTFGFIFQYGIGIRYMLLLLCILIIIAFLFMTRVTRGEYQLSNEEKERRKKMAESQDD